MTSASISSASLISDALLNRATSSLFRVKEYHALRGSSVSLPSINCDPEERLARIGMSLGDVSSIRKVQQYFASNYEALTSAFEQYQQFPERAPRRHLIVESSKTNAHIAEIELQDFSMQASPQQHLPCTYIVNVDVASEYRGTSATILVLRELLKQLTEKDLVCAHINIGEGSRTPELTNLCQLLGKFGFQAIITNPREDAILIFHSKNSAITKQLVANAKKGGKSARRTSLNKIPGINLQRKTENRFETANQEFPILQYSIGRLGGLAAVNLYRENLPVLRLFQEIDEAAKRDPSFGQTFTSEADTQYSIILSNRNASSDEIKRLSSPDLRRPLLGLPSFVEGGYSLPLLVLAAEANPHLPMPAILAQSDLGGHSYVRAQILQEVGFVLTASPLDSGAEISMLCDDSGKPLSFNPDDMEKLVWDKARTISSLREIENPSFKIPLSLSIGVDDNSPEAVYEIIAQWLEKNPEIDDIVLKTSHGALGLGVYFSSRGEKDEIIEQIDALIKIHHGRELVIQERIIPVKLDDPTFTKTDWNIRLLASQANGYGCIDAEIRCDEAGDHPVNKSRNAKVIPFEDLAKHGFSSDFLATLQEKLALVGYQICKKFDLAFAGIDIILRGDAENYDIYIIEVNGKASGGIETLFNLRRGPDRNRAAVRLLEALTKTAEEKGKKIIAEPADTAISPKNLLKISIMGLHDRSNMRTPLGTPAFTHSGRPPAADEALEYAKVFLYRFSLARALKMYHHQPPTPSPSQELKGFMLSLADQFDQDGVAAIADNIILALTSDLKDLTSYQLLYLLPHCLLTQDDSMLAASIFRELKRRDDLEQLEKIDFPYKLEQHLDLLIPRFEYLNGLVEHSQLGSPNDLKEQYPFDGEHDGKIGPKRLEALKQLWVHF